MFKISKEDYEQDLEESREEGTNEVFEIMKRKGIPEEVIQSIMEMSRSEMRV